MVKYVLHLTPHLRLLLDAVHMFNMCDILLYEGYDSLNVYMFRNGSLINNDITILGGYFDYCIRSSIRFIILIYLEIMYNYFVSFFLLMAKYLIILLLIILLNNFLFLLSYQYPGGLM